MNKDEFLRRLEEALSGEVPASVIRDNLNYYADYLSQELGKGRTMDEIIEALQKKGSDKPQEPSRSSIPLRRRERPETVMEVLRTRPRGAMTEEALTARKVIRTAPRRISIISI